MKENTEKSKKGYSVVGYGRHHHRPTIRKVHSSFAKAQEEKEAYIKELIRLGYYIDSYTDPDGHNVVDVLSKELDEYFFSIEIIEVSVAAD